MKHTLKSSDIAIITTQPVEKTFNNEDAFLYSTAEQVKDDADNKTRTYKTRTDLVGYTDVEVQLFNEDGTPKLDADSNAVFETKEQLIWLEQKQDWSITVFTYAEIDGFSEEIAALIPDELTRTQRDLLELQTVFLMRRKNDSPWGIAADKWRLRTNSDLLITKIK